MAQPLRFSMLEAVAFSDLTPAAIRVYLALHIWARERGIVDVRRRDIEERLQISERELRYRITELRNRGFVRSDRGLLALGWADEGAIYCRFGGNVLPVKRQVIASSEGRIKSIGTQEQEKPLSLEETPNCERCGDSGWIVSVVHGAAKVPCHCRVGQAIRGRLSVRRRALGWS